MTNPLCTAAEDQITRLLEFFAARGAKRFNTGILQPADTLLDLYGEDIRSRAFVTHDPLLGELMLRPDFTVPLAQHHMGNDMLPGSYTYRGPVFRRQEISSTRPHETVQVGYEVFGEENHPEADAEVFCAFVNALAPLKLRFATGDLGLLTAAIESLNTSVARKSALKRHMWRPKRFGNLLAIYSTDNNSAAPVQQKTDHLISEILSAGPDIGMRSVDEVAARLLELADEKTQPPIDENEAAAVRELLGIKGTLDQILPKLNAIGNRLEGVGEAIDELQERKKALEQGGVDSSEIWFEASYGRTTLEYYDGFVFGFLAPEEETLVALGGRYDFLTQALGKGRICPAVGGVIRTDVYSRMLGNI